MFSTILSNMASALQYAASWFWSVFTACGSWSFYLSMFAVLMFVTIVFVNIRGGVGRTIDQDVASFTGSVIKADQSKAKAKK